MTPRLKTCVRVRVTARLSEVEGLHTVRACKHLASTVQTGRGMCAAWRWGMPDTVRAACNEGTWAREPVVAHPRDGGLASVVEGRLNRRDGMC